MALPFGPNLVAFRMLLGPGTGLTTPNYDIYSSSSGLLNPLSSATQTGGRVNVGYYNSGFLSGLGGVLKSVGPYIAAAGSIAAEVLPAIYHTGTSGATQTSAAGPTAAPVVSKPAMRSTALTGGSTTAIGRAEQAILHPIQTTEQLMGFGGGGHTTGRYGSPGEKGFHMIKRGPHAGMWVRNRHRNPCNIKALRRSLSRLHGFERVARKVIHFTHPRRAVGHAVFKKRRRSH